MSTAQLYEKNLAFAGRNLIVGDSQEVRLIHELKQRGLNIVPAEKGTGSVTAGISLMLEFEIIIEAESKDLLKEFNNYSWVDKTNKSIPEDKWNHGIDAARYYISKTVANPNRGKYHLK